MTGPEVLALYAQESLEHHRPSGVDPEQRRPAGTARHRHHPSMDRGRGDNAGVARRSVGLLDRAGRARHRRLGQRPADRQFPRKPSSSGDRLLVRTDDEVYRVDSVWLGPPRATFPWRARYVSYGVGLLVMIVVMFLQRRVGIGLDFFSVAWALVITIVITRFIGKRINYERPLGQVVELFRHEITGPRAARPSGVARSAPTTCGSVRSSGPASVRGPRLPAAGPDHGPPRKGRAAAGRGKGRARGAT